MREVEQSIDLIRQCIEKMPRAKDLPLENKPRGKSGRRNLHSPGAARGESSTTSRPTGPSIWSGSAPETPTFANIPAMIKLVKGCELADVPNIILTIDPCISCTER